MQREQRAVLALTDSDVSATLKAPDKSPSMGRLLCFKVSGGKTVCKALGMSYSRGRGRQHCTRHPNSDRRRYCNAGYSLSGAFLALRHEFSQCSLPCRLLCFKLTDGKTTCKALEFRPLQGAEGDSIAPGAKVLITGATVKAGIIIVDARSLKVSSMTPSYLVLNLWMP